MADKDWEIPLNLQPDLSDYSYDLQAALRAVVQSSHASRAGIRLFSGVAARKSKPWSSTAFRSKSLPASPPPAALPPTQVFR